MRKIIDTQRRAVEALGFEDFGLKERGCSSSFVCLSR